MSMTVGELINNKTLGVLARLFAEQNAVTALLLQIGYPREHTQPWGNTTPYNYWMEICQQLENGIIAGGIERLLEAAAAVYPGQDALQPWRPTSASPETAAPGPSLHVEGPHDIRLVFTEATRLARAAGLPNPRAVYATNDSACLHFPEATPDQVNQIREDLSRRHADIRLAVTDHSDGGDYLLNEVFAEGPDSARFEISKVPASTRAADLAAALTSEYSDANWPMASNGVPLRSTIDLIDPGTQNMHRLNPEQTLHQNGVQDGATCLISPESGAGGVSPLFRDQALARARAQAEAYVRGHAGFELEANARNNPTEYLLRFPAPGWAPPQALGAPPIPIDTHELFIFLDADFPIKAPQVFWRSPVFHPNVHPETGYVCLGALADGYRPGLDFGQLLQMLVDMASYQNYSVIDLQGDGRIKLNILDREAGAWAISPEGQKAITARGGRALFSYLSAAPRRLRINKLPT